MGVGYLFGRVDIHRHESHSLAAFALPRQYENTRTCILQTASEIINPSLCKLVNLKFDGIQRRHEIRPNLSHCSYGGLYVAMIQLHH